MGLVGWLAWTGRMEECASPHWHYTEDFGDCIAVGKKMRDFGYFAATIAFDLSIQISSPLRFRTLR